jgi:aspartyl/asparaginyl-tRNA synthetase
MVPVFERVYEIGRAYRAEKSNTSRHMSEILMLDMEMGFIDSFDDIIEMTEKFINYVVEKTWEEAEKLLTDL